jgi:ubiquinone/menaquinone biosynthesis C-methylase UbiE
MPEDNIGQIKAYWGQHWAENQDASIDLRDVRLAYKYHLVAQHLKTLPRGSKVLEIGCGNCQWLRILREHYPQHQYHALDVADECVFMATKMGFNAIQADARDIPLATGTMDLVFSWGVVEHFDDTKKAVSEHIRILRPGGILVIDVPNRMSLCFVQEEIGHIKHHRTDRQKIMSEFGKRFWPSHFMNILQNADPAAKIQHAGSGPVLPLRGPITTRLDDWVPGFIRKRWGGNLGFVVKKTA